MPPFPLTFREDFLKVKLVRIALKICLVGIIAMVINRNGRSDLSRRSPIAFGLTSLSFPAWDDPHQSRTFGTGLPPSSRTGLRLDPPGLSTMATLTFVPNESLLK
jgi:hypothetical protein